MIIEKVLTVKDIPPSNPCNECKVCLRLRLLEMGLIEGQKIKIREVHRDLWTVALLDENNVEFSRIGMRKEEVDRILFEESCIIDLE